MSGTAIETTFTSVTGNTLDRFVWLPDSKPKGIVQFVHGMAEHMGRYDAPARALNAAGYIVVGHTHLGHGKQAETLGWFGEKDGWQYLIDDVHANRLLTQKEYPDLPYFLLGHSMGSFVVRCYLTEHSEGLAGAIISGTGSYTAPVLAAGLTLANLLCLFGQAKKPAPLINNIAFAANNKAFEPARTPNDWLSRDEAVVDRYQADPYCGHLFTASGYRELFRGLKRMSNVALLKNIQPQLPILFFSGDADPVGECGKGVQTAAAQMKEAGIKNINVCLYQNGRHEMFNELNRQDVYNDLINWLNLCLQ